MLNFFKSLFKPKKTFNEELAVIVAIQCTNGTWNYDQYMHGMANGLILAQAIVDGTVPTFLAAPKTWTKDLPSLAVPTTQGDPDGQ